MGADTEGRICSGGGFGELSGAHMTVTLNMMRSFLHDGLSQPPEGGVDSSEREGTDHVQWGLSLNP